MELNVIRHHPLPVHIYFKDNPELLVSINKRYKDMGLTFEYMSAPTSFCRGVLLTAKPWARRSFLRDVRAFDNDAMIREAVLMTLDDWVINDYVIKSQCDLIVLYEVILEHSMERYLNKILRIGAPVPQEV